MNKEIFSAVTVGSMLLASCAEGQTTPTQKPISTEGGPTKPATIVPTEATLDSSSIGGLPAGYEFVPNKNGLYDIVKKTELGNEVVVAGIPNSPNESPTQEPNNEYGGYFRDELGNQLSATAVKTVKDGEGVLTGFMATVKRDDGEVDYYYQSGENVNFTKTVAGLIEENGKLYRYKGESELSAVSIPEWIDVSNFGLIEGDGAAIAFFKADRGNGEIGYAVVENNQTGELRVLPTRWDLLSNMDLTQPAAVDFINKVSVGHDRIIHHNGAPDEVVPFTGWGGGGSHDSITWGLKQKNLEGTGLVIKNQSGTNVLYSSELEVIYYQGFEVLVAKGIKLVKNVSGVDEVVDVVTPLAVKKGDKTGILFPAYNQSKFDVQYPNSFEAFQKWWTKQAGKDKYISAWTGFGFVEDEFGKASANGYKAWLECGYNVYTGTANSPYRKVTDDKSPTVTDEFINVMADSGDYDQPATIKIDTNGYNERMENSEFGLIAEIQVFSEVEK